MTKWHYITSWQEQLSLMKATGYPQLKSCAGFELLRCIPNCKVLEPIEIVISAKKLESSSSRIRENMHPSNTKILICYPPKVWNLFFLILSVKGKMCLLFERVSNPKFTITCVNALIIKLLVRWWYRWCYGRRKCSSHCLTQQWQYFTKQQRFRSI